MLFSHSKNKDSKCSKAKHFFSLTKTKEKENVSFYAFVILFILLTGLQIVLCFDCCMSESKTPLIYLLLQRPPQGSLFNPKPIILYIMTKNFSETHKESRSSKQT